jgi:hypothetical protein
MLLEVVGAAKTARPPAVTYRQEAVAQAVTYRRE